MITTGPITITVADPGYDWTAWFVAGGVALGLGLLAVLLYYVVPRFTTSRRSARLSENFGIGLFVISIVATALTPLVGGIVGWSVHSSIVHGEKEAVLAEEYGITHLEEFSDSSMVSAIRDGEPITGLMTETVPRTFVFQELVAK